MFILKWFNKKIKKQPEKPSIEFEDSLEIALWDIKEKYDLETEEVVKAVFEKRQNIEYMRKTLKRDL